MFMEISYNVSNNNIHIDNSYKIKSKESMLNVLNDIYNNNNYCSNVFNRSMDSLLNEWGAHNLFYNLHLFRSHTRDVDLDYPQKKWLSICYNIVGFIYFMFH